MKTPTSIEIAEGKTTLKGNVIDVPNSMGWVIFAHGAGSSRMSPRNNWVAGEINKAGFSTLLFDLLTPQEDSNHENRFNIPLLTQRLILATNWLLKCEFYKKGQPIAYFGASTGAAAALTASVKLPEDVPLFAIISRGGRPDLAAHYLEEVNVPTLLIVGEKDYTVVDLNQTAHAALHNSNLSLVPGATHLFEEPGALGEVTKMAIDWIERYLPSAPSIEEFTL